MHETLEISQTLHHVARTCTPTSTVFSPRWVHEYSGIWMVLVLPGLCSYDRASTWNMTMVFLNVCGMINYYIVPRFLHTRDKHRSAVDSSRLCSGYGRPPL
ncbi:hypothetical protein BDV10DRAFT_155092 [Aspergillus recurvatus]